jgi:hypothetical protein
MNGRDDEAWLDTLLQRRLPPTLSDDGFRREVLRNLPPRERPALRAFILVLSWIAAALTLILPVGGDMVLLSSTDAGVFVVPACLATAVLWYLADRLM